MLGSVLAQDRELQACIPVMEDCVKQALRRVRTRMLTRSGTDTPMRLLQVRLCSVGELMNEPDVQDAAAWSSFFMERGGVAGFAAIEGPLLERLTARLFGDSTGPSIDMGARSATEVELCVATRMCDELFAALEAHWPVKPAPRLTPHPATANRHGVGDSSMSAAALACTVECGPVDQPLGKLTLALPAVMLRGIGGAADHTATARAAARRRANYDRLYGCEIEMIVELKRLSTTLGALRALKVGDAVPLGALGEVRALVNGTPSFAGEPGACDGLRSFRVSRRVLTIENIA